MRQRRRQDDLLGVRCYRGSGGPGPEAESADAIAPRLNVPGYVRCQLSFSEILALLAGITVPLSFCSLDSSLLAVARRRAVCP